MKRSERADVRSASGFKWLSAALLVSALAVAPASAQKVSGGKKISSDLFGLFFEDINYSADGGLYAELIQNRSFEYSPTEQPGWNPYAFWQYMAPGFSYGRISVETAEPLHANNPHYMVLEVEHIGHEKDYVGQTGVGLKNAGFDGMVIRKGESYDFSLFGRLLSDTPIELSVTLQTPKGAIIAEQKVQVSSASWKKEATVLTATEACDSASLVVLAQHTGRFAVDMISLFPQKTFRNRPNGLRADMAQLLADMKPRFIRFPGGCLVHGDGLGNMYRWKNTIGPVEQRKAQRNIWGYHQTTGLGFYEYFQFCEDIGAKPLPVLPAGVSCQNSGGTWRVGGTGQKALPMSEMDDYIQEVLDLIEWANGPVTSTWGAKRAEAGHPAPFNLQYVGIGNEDKITSEFNERYALLQKAVEAKYPNITVVGTVGPAPEGEDFEKGWTTANKLNTPVVDEHYYTSPDWMLKNEHRYDTYNRKASHVYLGEYASGGNALDNAIAEAYYMIGMERNGDVVRMSSYAPLFAKKNHTQWKTDMIFFDNTTLCPTPSYYTQKLFSANQGDYYFNKVVSFNKQQTQLNASCVMDSRTGDVIVKLVNYGSAPQPMKVNLGRFGKLGATAVQTVLTGDKTDVNTFEKTDKVAPVVTTIPVQKAFNYNAPAMSLTVIRYKTK